LENKRTYGIRLRLDAVVCFCGEKPCFYALYSKIGDTGEIVAVSVIKPCQTANHGIVNVFFAMPCKSLQIRK